MKRVSLFFGLALIFAGYQQMANAHGRYILPSHTLLSGKEARQVTLLASISNDIFHPDKPLGNNGGGEVNAFLTAMFKQLQASVTEPTGKVNETIQWQAFSRQSIADMTVEQSGTYRVSLVQKPVPMTTFKKADGTADRVFGKKPLPSGATDVVKRTVASRVETYITHNTLGKTALKAVGSGVELVGESHPNDLFVGEEASFKLLLDGKPLTAAAEVEITLGGTRHRNQRATEVIKTQPDGRFSVMFKDSGFYLLEVDYTHKGKPGSGVDFHHNSLYVTLEVFPE